jgi:predicted nucleic acid-binding protein
MAHAFLDTTAFIDYWVDYPGVRGRLNEILRSADSLFFSPVTTFEPWVRRMDRTEEARHLSLLDLCTEAPFDGRASSGRRRLPGDAIIAATAASLGATIHARNPRDFIRFYTDVQSY